MVLEIQFPIGLWMWQFFEISLWIWDEYYPYAVILLLQVSSVLRVYRASRRFHG